MKQRRTKILALFLAATMAVGSPVTAFSVSAEDWASADEIAGFESDWESTDTQESADDFAAVESEAAPEASSDAAVDDFFSSEDGFASEVTEEAAGEAVGTEAVETGLGEKTEFADGTYVPDDFSFSGGTGKVTITCPSIVIENGVVYGNILFSSKKYTQIKLNGEVYPVLSTEDGSLFKIPVVLNQDMAIAATTVAMTEAHDVNYTLKITQDTSKFTPKPEEKADYTAVDAALAKVPSDLSIYTEETAKAVTDAVAAVQRDYGKSRQAEVDAMASKIEAAVAALVKKAVEPTETELAITNNAAMFKAQKAVLHKDENGTSLIVTLSGSGYHYLYKGTYEEAVANGDNRANWCAGALVDGKWQFTIPVSEGETKLALVAISNSYLTKYEQGLNTLERAFYPRQAVIDYDAKTLVTGDFDHTIDLTVTNNVKMFNVAAAALHTIGGPISNNYQEILQLTMGSDSFDQLYVGTAAEAAAAESTIAITSRKADVVVKANTMGGSTAVDYLDKATTLAFHSAKNEKWYERVFTVSKTGKTVVVDPVPVPATGITLDASEKSAYAGESFTLTATVEPKGSTDKAVWSSDKENVAKVDQNGTVTTVGEGTAVITAKAGNFSAQCTVTVKKGFSIGVKTYLLDENGATPSRMTGVEVTLTDSEGNVLKETSQNTTTFSFTGIDATKEYTLKVVRDGCYVIDGKTKEPAGYFVYTTKVTKENDGASYSVYFKKDALIAALKKAPADYSLYDEASVQAVKDAIAAANPDETDFAKRDEAAAKIEEAVSKLVLKDGKYAAAAEPGESNAGFEAKDVVIFTEDGVLKASFTGTQPVYKRLYLGTASEAKKAVKSGTEDPKLIQGVAVEETDGSTSYRFTMPIPALNTKVKFVANSGIGTRWLSKALTFTTDKVTKGITLDTTEEMLNVGSEKAITATAAADYSIGKKITWTSSDEKVATVTDGTVKAVGEGKAVITAQVGEFTAECQITVHTFETLPARTATCTRTSLTEGLKCSVCGEILKAQVEGPALGHKEVVLPAVKATCTKDGWSEGKKCSVCGIILKARKLVKASGHKEVVIPAVAATQGHTGLTEGKKCSVCGEILAAQKTTPALPILVAKVTVSAKNSVKVAAGKKVQLQVKTAPSNADNSAVTWKSSNTKVATVNAKGVVTMKKNAGGKAVVITATAKDGSKVYGSIKLTCMKGYVKKITISGKKTVKKGKTLKLKANVTASSKANKSVVWRSSNTKVATVSSKGVVKGKKKGTVTITVRSLDGTNKKATIKIKVK